MHVLHHRSNVWFSQFWFNHALKRYLFFLQNRAGYFTLTTFRVWVCSNIKINPLNFHFHEVHFQFLSLELSRNKIKLFVETLQQRQQSDKKSWSAWSAWSQRPFIYKISMNSGFTHSLQHSFSHLCLFLH